MSLSRILITGATGLLGSSLIERWQSQYEIWGLSRRPDHARGRFPNVHWCASVDELPKEEWFAVINLAGESIAQGRWSSQKKQRIRESRLSVTREILRFSQVVQPKLILSGSAIGFYGPQDEEPVTEASKGVDSFSHTLCKDWESEVAGLASELSATRICYLRTGVVLAAEAGALAKMLPPFKFGLGGAMGHGKQYFSWIHIADWLAAVDYIISNAAISGAVNLTAPLPVTNAEFSKTLAKVLKRPCVFPMPVLIAKLAFGEMAEELLLTGQNVIPEKLMRLGFQFQYSDCQTALENLLQ